MKEVDEPMLTSGDENIASSDAGLLLVKRIRDLISNQSYAVLCTQFEAQPYGSLVAFAASESLREIVFATPVTTRKYHFMKECPNVAMFIDSRQGPAAALMEIEAVTATGVATEVTSASERQQWTNLLSQQHKYLDGFLSAESCALFLVKVGLYVHVTRFQEVSQWDPRRA